MDRGSAVAFLLLLALLVVVAVGLAPPGADETGAYNRTTVTAEDANGTTLATVDVRIADTVEKRYVGLSNTSSLPTGEGMLFVQPAEESHTFVMREMDFPLDIIFVRADGTISRIHHAPVPEEIPDGNGAFEGIGKYVLEVPRGWANATGVEEGDRIVVPESVREDESAEAVR